ncbi:MAG: Gfo/Idh/MocA family oxidoreductase [Chloroflexi bacterium]|nr:MAG: Gfo/Idh/MocA family oxidoreductase [Chloroflexota bacterium]
MGRNHLRVLSDLVGTELGAVSDQDPKTVASWREMLAEEQLDALVVAVPTRSHCEVGVAALERGLHVLVEKPIAYTLEEGRASIQQCVSFGGASPRESWGGSSRSTPAVRERSRRESATSALSSISLPTIWTS